ncbi:hypothetical protein ACN27F_23035 [Solwaraspora sp. WMMB335]|uniref:hypothetical protein n=1 Tax=Solwaraspora sp. WMMB335 TaxID=3404118 RepID=UPI003B952E9B
MSDETRAVPAAIRLEAVLLDRAPKVFALCRFTYDDSDDANGADDIEPVSEVIGWAFAMPDGEVLIVRTGDTGNGMTWCNDLASASRFWAPMIGADLLAVA